MKLVLPNLATMLVIGHALLPLPSVAPAHPVGLGFATDAALLKMFSSQTVVIGDCPGICLVSKYVNLVAGPTPPWSNLDG